MFTLVGLEERYIGSKGQKPIVIVEYHGMTDPEEPSESGSRTLKEQLLFNCRS